MGPYDETDGGTRLNNAGRKSADAPRLHTKRSRGRVQSENLVGQQCRGELGDSTRNEPGVPVRGSENGAGQRKGSLRNAVRKLFGRRPKESDELPPTKASPPRHQYHKSEPPTLYPHSENPEYEPSRRDLTPQRILSAPLQLELPASFSRVRSPYAVEFPQSARLKPLNLGSPFDAPGSQLRRRKTLPSILIADDEAEAIASSIKSAGPPPVPARPSDDLFRTTPEPEIGLAIDGIRNPKRRSRSAGDMKQASLVHPAERKRSEEIKFWRESFQGSVLRTSGFTVPVRRQETEAKPCDRDDVATPTRHKAGSGYGRVGDTLHSRQSTLDRLQGSPPYDMRSNSAFGTELSRDLEDRVAKLEANLQSFQRSLNRLQAEKNRRTVVIGDDSSGARISGVRRSNRTDELTPSMLVDDLHEPFANSSQYLYNAEPAPEPYTSRPSTAPYGLSLDTMTQVNSFVPPVPHLAGSFQSSTPYNTTTTTTGLSAAATGGASSSRAQSSTQWSTTNATGASDRVPTRSVSSTHLSTSPNVTFKSLYQMLSDERSARRRLEGQMRGLRTEIQDLHFQVQTQSRIQSQRSSYMLSQDATIPSSRLRELLRETDDSPTNSPVRGDGGTFKLEDPRIGAIGADAVVSRFSGSTTHQESIAEARSGAPEDSDYEREETEGEAQTPCEVYETPTEGRSPFGYGRDHDGGMF